MEKNNYFDSYDDEYEDIEDAFSLEDYFGDEDIITREIERNKLIELEEIDG